MGRAEVQKLINWDKDSLIKEAKAACTSKAKPGIYSFPPINRQVFSHYHHMSWGLGKQTHSDHPLFLLLSINWAHLTLWDIPLVSRAQLSWLRRFPPPPSSLCTPACLVHKHCSATAKTECYLHCFGQIWTTISANPLQQSPDWLRLDESNLEICSQLP